MKFEVWVHICMPLKYPAQNARDLSNSIIFCCATFEVMENAKSVGFAWVQNRTFFSARIINYQMLQNLFHQGFALCAVQYQYLIPY